MSNDAEAEQRVYDAITAVMNIPRPKERERIFREAIKTMSALCGWETIFPGSGK